MPLGPLLAARLNQPLLLQATMAEGLYALNDQPLEAPMPNASRFVGERQRTDNGATLAPISGSTAIVSIVGGLVNRGAWIGNDFCTGLVSYEGLRAQLRDIERNDKIKTVLLDIDSPGGEASGMFTLAGAIHSLRRTKRVVAVVDDVAASAAYGLASAADEIVISPTSVLGSIGVMLIHIDQSVAMQRRGLKPTLIYAGENKADGHPFGALPEAVRADMQRNVETIYEQFVGFVGRGRGSRFTASAARKTEARIFIGKEAVTAGLADRFGTLDEVLAELNRPTRAKSLPQKKGSTMFGEPDPAAVASIRAQERARIKSIMSSANAKGREVAAAAFALDSDMPAEAAIASLASLPAAAATIPAPGQRTEAAVAEIGASGAVGQTDAVVIQAGWKKAFGGVR